VQFYSRFLNHFQLTGGVEIGPMLLFTGYRSHECDLYVKEKANMVNLGVLDFAFLALSRDPVIPRVISLITFLIVSPVFVLMRYILSRRQQTYVQDKLLEAAPLVYRMLRHQHAHFYVCGDCAMAEDVANTLRQILQKAGGMDQEESESYLIRMRVDIFFCFFFCFYYD